MPGPTTFPTRPRSRPTSSTTPNIQAQHSGWKSDEADKLFEQSQQETDPVQRAAQYKRIQEIYLAEAPMLFIYETPYPVALQQKVKGFIQIPLGNNIFVGALEIALEAPASVARAQVGSCRGWRSSSRPCS